MSKSVLYASNTTSQTITVGNVVNFGNIVRRYGCNCNLNGSNIVLNGSGYYSASSNINFTAIGTTTTITFLDNGVAIQGASATLTTEAGNSYAISIPFVVRNYCKTPSNITMVISGSNATVTNVSVVVEKL